MVNHWDERYGTEEYAYGEAPNRYFAEQLSLLPRGRIILPCDGEGRNAVFAAVNGWDVFPFDLSEEGKKKAISLAAKHKVDLHYEIADALAVELPENSADVVAFIYAHFPAAIRSVIHKKAIQWLKPGGRIILEAFNPAQLKNTSGGPKELSMLYTVEMIGHDFDGLQTVELLLLQTDLSEGPYHQGAADVIRFTGIKK